MGMPCEINSIVKLDRLQYPSELVLDAIHLATKGDYRIFPIDVPLQLVDADWMARADVVITKLSWEKQQTVIEFRIDRVYDRAFSVK
jgi:Protein of unknown function (DUF2584)